MAGLLRSIFNKLNTIPKCTPNFVKYEACLPSTFNLPNQLYSNMPQQEEIDPNKDRLITEGKKMSIILLSTFNNLS